jgi:hypothetical protein
LAQRDPNQDRPPAGVVASLGQGRITDRVRIGMRELLGRLIVGCQAVGPTLAESFAQLSHGARGEAEGSREAGGGLALLGALE